MNAHFYKTMMTKVIERFKGAVMNVRLSKYGNE